MKWNTELGPFRLFRYSKIIIQHIWKILREKTMTLCKNGSGRDCKLKLHDFHLFWHWSWDIRSTENDVLVHNKHFALKRMISWCISWRWLSISREYFSWNNGKEVPRWGVAEIKKMSPSTTGRCYCCHLLSSYWLHELSADQSPSRNCIRRPGVVGKTILDVQTWSKE